MDFQVEKYVSNFVRSQFPAFYNEEGENFILFMKAYYEWMENDWGTTGDAYGGPVLEARNLFDYRDVDNTIEKFLEYFQRKYLYGIPFKTIANPRFLLKHILDVYRSKGTVQCYRLLFKLIYNQDIDVYLPGNDILRASDGTWVEPKYLEVTQTDNVNSFVGRTIQGVSSGTTAVVESYIKEAFNRDIINTIYISNVLPRGGDFVVGEKIVLPSDVGNTSAVIAAPKVLGSLYNLEITNGGQDFKIGDVIKIAHNDISNGDIISYGVDGLLRVTALSRGFGSLTFDIKKGGFGYMANAATFVYKNDANGDFASFVMGSISNTRLIEYNTDIICDYSNLAINTASYGFPGNTSANQSSNIGIAFSYTNNIFGTISTLTIKRTGNGYTQPANVFVRSCQFSKNLPGTLSYNTGSNTVTGTNTKFDWIYANNDVIYLQANSTLGSSIELAVIREVVSATSIKLYGPPSKNSTASAIYKAAPVILPSNFARHESVMDSVDGSINGVNERIFAIPSQGNNVISAAIAINSGKGYVEGENIKAYLYSGVSNNIAIISSGNSYSNGDTIIFSGGSPGTPATGFVSTNTSGNITSATLSYPGSGYIEPPKLIVKSANGAGAVLSSSLTELNTVSEITGRVINKGMGNGRGFWSTNRSFLNSDKYIQDSYYYQDYSYEIKVAETLDKYKNILYSTFHTAGSELFGKYLSISIGESLEDVLYDSKTAQINNSTKITADYITYTADSSVITADV